MLLRFGTLNTGRIIVFLVIVIIILQIWHIKMLNREETDRNIPDNNNNNVDSNQLLKDIISRLDNAHILDSSGSYYVVSDIFSDHQTRSDKDLKLLTPNSDDKDITLVSQTSSSHLDDVVALSERWSGRISVSVFMYSGDFGLTIESLLSLYSCQPYMGNRVSIHVVFPVSHTQSFSDLKINSAVGCQKKTMPKQQNYEIHGIEYPHNLLRNVALKSCLTEYVFVIDIDMVPSGKLREEFNQLMSVRSVNESVVYVVPSFESRKELDIPKDKLHLLKQWRTDRVRPFYYDVCWKCQSPLDYEKWKFLAPSQSLDIAYFIDWKDPWEPFYIASKTLPLYDERFKQYGFNRISQVCEANIAGAHFGVLNNAFLVHEGYKYKDSFHGNKDAENNRNRDLYRQFKNELKTKYPKSSRSC